MKNGIYGPYPVNWREYTIDATGHCIIRVLREKIGPHPTQMVLPFIDNALLNMCAFEELRYVKPYFGEEIIEAWRNGIIDRNDGREAFPPEDHTANCTNQ